MSVLWGVAFANLVQGMSIEVGRYDKGAFTAVDPAAAAGSLAENHHYLTGGFLSLLTPFTLLGGLVTLTLFLSHGALYLAIKTTGDLRDRAKAFAAKSAVVAAAVTGNALSALPLALCALCLAATALLIAKGDEVKAFIAHFAGIAMAVVFIWFAIFPDAMKSSIDGRYSLTLSQAAATAPTQTIMTIAAAVFVPIVLAYTVWSYRVFARRLAVDQIPDAPVGLDPKRIREFDAR